MSALPDALPANQRSRWLLPGTLTVGGLSLNGSGGSLAIELSSTDTTTGGSVNDLIQVTGAPPSMGNADYAPIGKAPGSYVLMR